MYGHVVLKQTRPGDRSICHFLHWLLAIDCCGHVVQQQRISNDSFTSLNRSRWSRGSATKETYPIGLLNRIVLQRKISFSWLLAQTRLNCDWLLAMMHCVYDLYNLYSDWSALIYWAKQGRGAPPHLHQITLAHPWEHWHIVSNMGLQMLLWHYQMHFSVFMRRILTLIDIQKQEQWSYKYMCSINTSIHCTYFYFKE